MSFCFLYNVVSENYSVQNSPWGGGGSIASSRSISFWRKYVHEVLVNLLGGLSLPRKSVVRLTDRPDMTWTLTTT